jgi:hypothetical protein
MSGDQRLSFIRTTTVFDGPFRIDVASGGGEAKIWCLPTIFSDEGQSMDRASSLNPHSPDDAIICSVDAAIQLT